MLFNSIEFLVFLPLGFLFYWKISLKSLKLQNLIVMAAKWGGSGLKIRNTFIIFLVTGFWHGANWTFIIWVALNAIYFLHLLLANMNLIYGGRGANYSFIFNFK